MKVRTGFVIEISAKTREFLERAGWTSGRLVRVDDEVPADHPAFEVLEAFGGLTLGQSGRGIEAAASDVFFRYQDHDRETIEVREKLLSGRLVGIGDTHHSPMALYMHEDGRIFELSTVHDAFAYTGRDFSEAMETLLLGLKKTPMIRPDQDEIMWYGESIKQGDPRLYGY